MKPMRPEWFLWKKRYRYELSQKKRSLSLVIDWVVALYFIIPAIICGAIFYVQGIASPPSWWNVSIVPIILTIPILFPVIFNVRPLFSLGDEGILIASPLSPRRLILYRWVEDMVIKLIFTLLLWGLLTPYLLILQYSYLQIITMVILFYFMSIFVVQNEWFWIGRTRWFHKIGVLLHMVLIIYCWAVMIDAVLSAQFLKAAIVTLLACIISILILQRNLRVQWPWGLLIQESVAKRIGLIDYILGGDQANKKITMKKKRPAKLLKGGLGLTFLPENALFLWYIKGFFRTKDRYFTYVQAMMYILLAVFFVPNWWVSAMILGVGLFMLGNVLFAPAKSSDHPWLIIYPFSFEQRNKGLAKGAFILNAFVGIIGSALITMHIGLWYYYFPIVIIAIIIAWGSIETAKMSQKN